jgi:hypothetical protein
MVIPDVEKKSATDFEKFIGPTYSYVDNINSPTSRAMGMSSAGSISVLGRDIKGLLAYVKLLVTGEGRASKTGKPLGNKFFLKASGLKCKDIATEQEVDRSVYYNYVPDGTVPFISNAMEGSGFSDFRGLVPGLLSNLNQIHPISMLMSFTQTKIPDCQAITMEFVNTDNSKGYTTGYVTNDDIKDMNPCWFPNKRNPVENTRCSEGFTSMRNQSTPQPSDEYEYGRTETTIDYSKMPNDLLIKLYYSSLGLLGLYIFLNMFLKKKL